MFSGFSVFSGLSVFSGVTVWVSTCCFGLSELVLKTSKGLILGLTVVRGLGPRGLKEGLCGLFLVVVTTVSVVD